MAVEDLLVDLEQTAQETQSATSDGQSATHHNLKDKIAVINYLRGQETVAQTGTGWAALRIARFKPPSGGPE